MNIGLLHSIIILPGSTLACLPDLYSILYSPSEGENLEDRLGEDYLLYKTHVPGWIPTVRL
jgi:protein-S-isoprenylcysteine O-methyltransferase Ste14